MASNSALISFLFISISCYACHAFIIDFNSTNFYNMLWSRKYNLNTFHSYLFDYWQSLDVDKFVENLLKNDDGFDDENFDEDAYLKNLRHDERDESIINKIASLCGRLRNASSPYVSDDCLKDLDFVACALFEFVGAVKQFVKGECTYSGDAKEEAMCNEDLKTKLKDNIWALYMVDAFGKLPSGLNMGAHYSLGRYSDCKSITIPRTTHRGRTFEANYCRATFRLPLPETSAAITRQCYGVDNLINGPSGVCEPSENFARLKWGICAPKSCNTRNLTVLFRYTVFPTRNFCNVTVVCESDSEYFKDIKFLVCALIGVIIACLLIAGTLYDLFLYQPIYETLPDCKYDLINGDKREFELNGGFSDLIINNGKTKHEHYKDLAWYYKVLMAFSLYTNGSKIMSTDESPREFGVLNAVKALNTAWMIAILVNIYAISYIDNTKAIPKFVAGFWYQLVNNGSFVSDTFLLISGFSLCYWFLKRVHSVSEVIPVKFWLRHYAKRLFRIYPPYFFLLVVFLFVWHYFVRGPMWTVYFFNINSPLACQKSLLSNLFFVNNFRSLDSPCLPILQLLTLDMQLHLVAPLILVAILKFPLISIFLNSLLIITSSVLQVFLANAYDLPPSLMANADVFSLDKPLVRYYNIIFIKPYTRWSAFLIGIMLGQIVARKPKIIARLIEKYPKFLWMSAMATCAACIFGLTEYAKGQPLNPVSHGAYVALSRPIWSLSVALMIYMCITDKGGFAQFFLSQPFWAPFGRLSYSAFLVAPTIVLYGYAVSSSPIHLTSINMIYAAIGNIVMVYCAAFVFHLVFEAPFLNFRQLCFHSNDGQYHFSLTSGPEDGPLVSKRKQQPDLDLDLDFDPKKRSGEEGIPLTEAAVDSAVKKIVD